MLIIARNASRKLMCADHRIAKMYCQGDVIYSSGNVVTYMVDGTTYQEEVDEGASCLSPTTFTPEKRGSTFLGWSLSNTNIQVLSSLNMEDEPITLYAVFDTQTTVNFSYSHGYTNNSNSSKLISSSYLSQVTITGSLYSHASGGSKGGIQLRANGTIIEAAYCDSQFTNPGYKTVNLVKGPYNGLTLNLRVYAEDDGDVEGNGNINVTWSQITVG